MALIAWWPLNGNLKDYSGNNYELIGQNVIIDSIGKIGKCYLFDGNSSRKLFRTNFPQISATFTWTCWVYQTAETTTRQFIVSQGRDYQQYGINIANINNQINIFIGGTKIYTVTYSLLNKWTHITLACNNGLGKLYLNGILNSEFDYPEISFEFATNSAIVIGKMGYNYTSNTTYFPFNGKINDVRIYDHMLSQKEIKEISQAKILHYKCNEPEQYYKNLVTNGNFKNGARISGESGSYGVNDIVTLENPGGTPYVLRQDANGRECEIHLTDYTGCTAGTYMLSCWVGTTSDWNGGTQITHCRFYNGSTVIGTLSGSTYKIKETKTIGNINWKLVYEEVEVTNTVTNVAWYLGYGGHSTSPKGYRYITNVQITKGKEYLPFVYKENNGKIFDCSGFRNHAVSNSITTPVWVEDCALGSGSYKFDGSIKMSNGNYQHFAAENNILIPEEGTLAFFIKHEGTENSDNKYAVGFENFCSMNNADIVGLIYYNSASNYTSKTTNYNLRDGKWHQYVITWSIKNNTVVFYIDGKKISSQQPGTMQHVNTFRRFLVGNAWSTSYGGHSGGLDDIRVYATQLSDEDILNIYNCKTSVSKNGKIFTNEIVEINNYEGIINIKGQLTVNEINELDTLSFKTKTELGADWVRLFYHNNKAGTVLFSSDKSEFLKCNTVDKISDLWALEQFRGKDGKFELLLQYQNSTGYNRWKQSSNFTKESIAGYESVQCSWTTNYWGGLEINSSNSSTWVDGSVGHSNWYYAIGSKSVYSGGIPGPSNTETGWVELWVRCDNPNVFKIYKNKIITSTEFIEI